MSASPSQVGWRVILTWLHPWLLANSTLTYLMGLGVAHYLGVPLDVGLAWLGWLWAMALLAGAFLLDGAWTFAQSRSRLDESAQAWLRAGFWGAFGLLSLGAAISISLLRTDTQQPVLWILMLVTVGLLLWYALPPWQAARSGYGEIVMAVVGGGLMPALGFVLQAGSMHRLLAMTTLAMPFLYLAAILARELETYAQDVKHLRYTLLVRLGWKAGFRVHNALIFAALGVMAVALADGMPLGLGMPFGVALAWGGFQIWYLGRMEAGAPSHWKLLRCTSLALYALPAYLMTFLLWIR